ncbi:MAG: YlxR family protein [Marmoricola sp.]
MGLGGEVELGEPRRGIDGREAAYVLRVHPCRAVLHGTTLVASGKRPVRIRAATPVEWLPVVSQLDSPTRSDGPVRTCVGCRERAAKRELLRVVAGTDAEGQWLVVPDPRGTAPGRGAHLHPTPECLALAERKRAFTRALRHDAGGRGKKRGALSLERLREHLAQTDTENEKRQYP